MLHATLSTWEVEVEGSRPIKAFKKGSTPSVKKKKNIIQKLGWVTEE